MIPLETSPPTTNAYSIKGVFPANPPAPPKPDARLVPGALWWIFGAEPYQAAPSESVFEVIIHPRSEDCLAITCHSP